MKRPKLDHILGIDIGGTKISVIIGNPKKEKIRARKKFLLVPSEPPSKTIERIQHTYYSLLKQCNLTDDSIEMISVACPGSCDYKKGRALHFPNMPLWKGFSIKQTLATFLKNKPFIFDNDANAAALGEKYFGAGKNLSDFLYITVSTGVGGGLIINDKIYRGASHDAGEFGHMTIIKNGDLCGCGKRGCLEAYASGSSLAPRGDVRNFQAHHKKNEKGNRLSQKVLDEGIHSHALGIANSLQLLNLEAVILGGGVTRIGKPYFEALAKAVKIYTWPRPFKSCRIIPASLGDAVVDYGTMALALA
jgi:glucokinase